MEQKLSEKEIKDLKDIQQSQDQLITNFGQLEYQIQSLELEKDKLTEMLEDLKKKEVIIGKELNSKYGDGIVNIETGTFTQQSES